MDQLGLRQEFYSSRSALLHEDKYLQMNKVLNSIQRVRYKLRGSGPQDRNVSYVNNQQLFSCRDITYSAESMLK